MLNISSPNKIKYFLPFFENDVSCILKFNISKPLVYFDLIMVGLQKDLK